MNEDRMMRKLSRVAERARLETLPHVDVADRVMAALSSGTGRPAAGREPLVWIAAFSAAVAVPIAVLALASWRIWSDPVVRLLASVRWGGLL